MIYNTSKIIAKILNEMNFQSVSYAADYGTETCAYTSSFFDKETNKWFTIEEEVEVPSVELVVEEYDEEGSVYYNRIVILLPMGNDYLKEAMAYICNAGFSEEEAIAIMQVFADITRKKCFLTYGKEVLNSILPCDESEVLKKYSFAFKQTA